MSPTAGAPTASPPFRVPVANPPLGRRELAWWPEIADGAEGKDLVIAFVKSEDGSTTAMLETEDEAKRPGHTPILKGIKVTSIHKPKRKPVEYMLVKVDKQDDPIPAKVDEFTCDAVFSTQSAVRKFVRLYYEAHGMLDEEDWTKLNKAISDENVPAIGHVYPSRSAGVGGDLRFLTAKYDKRQFIGMEWLTLDQYWVQRAKNEQT